MSGQAWNVVQGDVVGPAIRLQVNPTAPEFAGRNDEAVRLISDSSGIRIIGKTSLAARHGAYIVLEKLGVRWFYKHPAWEVVPASLVDPGAFDEVDEPFYFWRAIVNIGTSPDMTATWNMRNRLYGAKYYSAGHTYKSIINKYEYYDTHPEWFLPTATSANPMWQLRPDNPDVVSRAIQYARTNLSKPPTKWSITWKDTVPIGSVSISPNDGWGWNPPWDEQKDWQIITDKVFGLANDVAKAIGTGYPDKYVSVYSYSWYSGVPTIALEPNLLVEIATAYNYTPLSLVERIRGLKAKGVVVGIRDYIDIWNWWQDAPDQKFDTIARLAFYASQGVRVYNGESGDGWGAKGPTYYLTSKMLWNPNENIDALLDDFYTRAFGPAKQVMKHYFETRNTDVPSLAASFKDLKQAESLAAGNEDILERIRHLEYYNRYLWLWKNKGIKQLNVDELKKFYTFINKVRDVYVVFFRYVEPELRKELATRGLTDAEIKSLQNFTPPTPSEARVMLDEAIASFTQAPSSVQSFGVNPRRIGLRPLSDNTRPGLEPLLGNDRTILVPSKGNEDIEIMVKGQQGTLQWYEPTGLLLDRWSFNSADNLTNWTPVTFRTELPGTYLLHITMSRPSASSRMSVDVPNRPASILADPAKVFGPEGDQIQMNAPAYVGHNESYFYVPQGATSFVFGAGVTRPQNPARGELTDPNGVTYPFDSGATAGRTFDTPVPGVWKITIDTKDTAGRFWLRGIPPLVWHDPRYLLVPSDTFTNLRRLEDPHTYSPTYSPQNSPPIAQDQKVSMNANSSNSITLLASDPDGNSLAYTVATGPSHGKLSGAPPVLTYTPSPDFSGEDSFKFTASDGAANSNSATVSISVNPSLVPYISPGRTGLRPLSDNTRPKLEPLYGNDRSIFIPSNGNEDVNVMVKGYAGVLQWYGPNGLLTDSWSFTSADNLSNWTPVAFRAALPGTYVLHITRARPSASWRVSVDVPNRPASMLADHGKQMFTPQKDLLSMNAPAYMGTNAVYFYVPQGTGKFSFGADATDSRRHAQGELIDPGGVKYPFDFVTTTEIPFDSPASGVWKLTINMPVSFGQFWLKGISPLVWNDPRYLLVP